MNIRIKISLALWFGLNCVLSNLYVEVLTLVLQNVTVMGSGVFKEVIKVNWGHWDGSYSNLTDGLIRRTD